MTRTKALVFGMDGCLSAPKNCTHMRSSSRLRAQGLRCPLEWRMLTVHQF
jgi:hypothetical protein